MREYQEEYLALLSRVGEKKEPSTDGLSPAEFEAKVRETNRASREAVRQGTELLRKNLFPVLDDILSSDKQEIDDLYEFAGKLMSGQRQLDVVLSYRIHQALASYARHRHLRDMLIRQLYLVGMSLYNMESMLTPVNVRVFSGRIRMCFFESASYFETEYDNIEDPETRGYIHRSMGNIALSYGNKPPESAERKLELIDRSLHVLTDPDVRKKTPSLPWDLYVYKSHQERTTLLSYLRSGRAGPKAFAQVLESAQIVQERQLKAARERQEPLQPRWQYAYMAAKYHSGAMLLPELLDGIYALSAASESDDYSANGMFAYLSAPALYMEYSKEIPQDKLTDRMLRQIERMTSRMLPWLVHAPVGAEDDQLLFYIRQVLYAYREIPTGTPFFEVAQDVLASRHPLSYMRMWIASRTLRELCGWAIDDCPSELVGALGTKSVEDVVFRRSELLDFAARAGRLYNMGMVHFFHMESFACRGQFEEEETLLRLHADFGAEMLSAHASTCQYADIARGHHRNFDERGGYPTDFSPRSSPLRGIIYLTAAADMIASATEETASRFGDVKSADEVFAELEEGAGTRYAPFVAGLLRCEERRKYIRGNLESWKQEACLHMYRRLAKK